MNVTFHATSKRLAMGGQIPGGANQPTSPRIATSFPLDDFNRLTQLAHQQGVPISAIVRNAVRAWLGTLSNPIPDATHPSGKTEG